MTTKFTEGQFEKLVDIQESYFPDNILNIGSAGFTLFDAIFEYDFKLGDFICDNNLNNEAVALMNPFTRDFVKDNLVEEDKFLFTKIEEVDDVKLHLNMLDDEFEDNRIFLDGDMPTPLTIKQVEDYGYNIDKFEKKPYRLEEDEDGFPF